MTSLRSVPTGRPRGGQPALAPWMSWLTAAAGLLAFTGAVTRTVAVAHWHLSGDVDYVDWEPEALLGQEPHVTVAVIIIFVILVGWALTGLPRPVQTGELTGRIVVWSAVLALALWVIVAALLASSWSDRATVRIGPGGVALLVGLAAGVAIQVVGLVPLRRAQASGAAHGGRRLANGPGGQGLARFRQLVPKATVRHIDAGHRVHSTEPEAYHRAISDVLPTERP